MRSLRSVASRPALAALALSVTVLVSGCSEIEDAATDTANGAACSVAERAVDGITGEVNQAIDEINADPAAAEETLSALRDVLETAQSGLSGDAQRALSDAADALGTLVDEAGEAARGVDVDTSAVDNAKEAFGDAVGDVQNIC